MIPITSEWTLFRMYGSALPRGLPGALAAVFFTMLLHGIRQFENDLIDSFRHPYPASLFASVLGFLIVFRTRFAYRRYWRALENLQAATSRWADTGTLCAAFHAQSLVVLGRDPNSDERPFLHVLTHYLSLMHALAVQSLRDDTDLNNLAHFYPSLPEPPVDPKDLPPHIKASFENKMTFFESRRRHVEYCKATPLPIIGGVSKKEREILGRIRGHRAFDNSATGHQPFAFRTVPDRVYRVHMWILEYITRKQLAGQLDMPPPILSRIYQVLSDAMMAYMKTRAVADTPFPFPYDQLTSLAVGLFLIVIPIMIVANVHKMWVACVITFCCSIVFCSLYEVNRELEEPFKYDPNDLPLVHYHSFFNQRMYFLRAGLRAGERHGRTFGQTPAKEPDAEKAAPGRRFHRPSMEWETGIRERKTFHVVGRDGVRRPHTPPRHLTQSQRSFTDVKFRSSFKKLKRALSGVKDRMGSPAASPGSMDELLGTPGSAYSRSSWGTMDGESPKPWKTPGTERHLGDSPAHAQRGHPEELRDVADAIRIDYEGKQAERDEVEKAGSTGHEDEQIEAGVDDVEAEGAVADPFVIAETGAEVTGAQRTVMADDKDAAAGASDSTTHHSQEIETFDIFPLKMEPATSSSPLQILKEESQEWTMSE